MADCEHCDFKEGVSAKTFKKKGSEVQVQKPKTTKRRTSRVIPGHTQNVMRGPGEAERRDETDTNDGGSRQATGEGQKDHTDSCGHDGGPCGGAGREHTCLLFVVI